MSYDYATLVDTAARLVERFGEPVSVKSYSESATGGTPWKGLSLTETTRIANAVFLPTKKENRATVDESANEQRKGAVYAYIQGALSGRSVIERADGTLYRVCNIETLNPAGTVLYHKVELES